MLRSCLRPLERCFGRIGSRDSLMWHMDLKPHVYGEFSIAVVQANDSLEDQGQVFTSPSSTFVGVYDGHGGPEASRFVSNSLLPYLDRFASEQGGLSAEVIKRAFRATEEDFVRLVKRSWLSQPKIASVGTCCLVGAIAGDMLYVANLGDSRAVLGRRSLDGKSVVAERLSTDHNVAVEEVRKEVVELHPDDNQIVVHARGAWRIKGIIQVSRAIGDIYLKKPEFSRDPLFQQFVSPLPLKRPVISAEPSIRIHKLKPHDLFLIFASDGLWEQLSDEAAAEIVSKNPRTGIAKRLAKAALSEAARKREMRYGDIKQIEKGIRRHFHDDITVIVIYLDQHCQVGHSKFNGYDAYLVGGCVRDLLMKRIPKDYDVITTADLNDVKRMFSHCDIVGKRFPICHVHVSDCIVEVSSFNTHARRQHNDLSYLPRKSDCDEHDYARWKNCLHRDFTINGLMFNPFSKIVYDYLGGLEDIRKAKVRTVKPAHLSFHEDCARILRAIRIAARLGFSFSKETAYSVKDLANSVLRLDKGRILMEMNYMLAYGSAENSLRLLWRFGILELLLPIQAAYFVSQGFRRRDKRSNMLLDIFVNLDKLLAPNRPCHNSLWVGILAFHQALVHQPRDPSVIATYCLALHNGGNLPEAVDIARSITRSHNNKFPELLKSREWNDGDLICEVMSLASSVTSALSSMTDEYFVSQAMARYPQAPYSDLVFIPLQLYLRAGRIFECLDNRHLERGYIAKKGNKINYYTLAEGGLAEIRHVFARVVFDTVFPPDLEDEARINPA